jgi:hypothetical protein
MDVVFILKHSPHNDFEIQHSLRSLALFAPWVRKVWIYGDRPPFISHDRSIIEQIPDGTTAPVLGVQTPVRNFFLQMVLSSLIPELFFEYLLFSDDFFLLKDFSVQDARQMRYIEDLSEIKARETGPWHDAIWRTYDLLTAMGLSGFNFETHTPTYLNRKWVLEAFLSLKEFAAENRWEGILGPTAVLNHAHRKEKFELVKLAEEKSRCGFWGNPPDYEMVKSGCKEKTFLNFDDPAFGKGIKKYLMERFANSSKYESEKSAG